jgi:hypothetical protein
MPPNGVPYENAAVGASNGKNKRQLFLSLNSWFSKMASAHASKLPVKWLLMRDDFWVECRTIGMAFCAGKFLGFTWF